MKDATVIENTTDLLAGVNRALGRAGAGQNEVASGLRFPVATAPV